MKKTLLNLAFALAAVLTLSPTRSQAQAFTDGFETPGTIGSPWVTDRYDPDSFSSVFFDGGNRLQLALSVDDSAANRPAGYSAAFYNTQGKSHVASISGGWVVTGRVFISNDMISGPYSTRTDLWASTAGGDYPIIGVVRNDPANPTNGTGPTSTRFRVYDPESASPDGWFDLPGTVAAGWHDLEINGGAAGFTFKIDNALVYTDTTFTAIPEDLSSVIVQGYNFGTVNANHYWDNVSATAAVPEPSTTLFGLLSVLGLTLRRRRK